MLHTQQGQSLVSIAELKINTPEYNRIARRDANPQRLAN